jgi:hypothetical protein
MMSKSVLVTFGKVYSSYYAYLHHDLGSGMSGVHVLGPDPDRFERLSTDSIRSIFRLIRLVLS